jgi:hypothetical protein
MPHHHTSSPELVRELEGNGFSNATEMADFYGNDKISRAIARAESIPEARDKKAHIRRVLEKGEGVQEVMILLTLTLSRRGRGSSSDLKGLAPLQTNALNRAAGVSPARGWIEGTTRG